MITFTREKCFRAANLCTSHYQNFHDLTREEHIIHFIFKRSPINDRSHSTFLLTIVDCVRSSAREKSIVISFDKIHSLRVYFRTAKQIYLNGGKETTATEFQKYQKIYRFFQSTRKWFLLLYRFGLFVCSLDCEQLYSRSLCRSTSSFFYASLMMRHVSIVCQIN